jgi:hypothetical protein
MMKVELKLTDFGLEKYTQLTEVVSMALANEVMAKLKQDIPRPPVQGSMKFKSDKQRKYVMAAIARGDITVPYRRGSAKSAGSESLQNAYRVNKEGTTVTLTNAASYVNFVIGNNQADIHKGRWKTAEEAVREVIEAGIIDQLTKNAIDEIANGGTQ